MMYETAMSCNLNCLGSRKGGLRLPRVQCNAQATLVGSDSKHSQPYLLQDMLQTPKACHGTVIHYISSGTYMFRCSANAARDHRHWPGLVAMAEVQNARLLVPIY